MSAAVLQWSSVAQRVGRAENIPPAVLLGLVDVESGGRQGLTSRTGAKGLTQFEPATAHDYGVNVAPGHAESQISGAARYLNALGYQHDPRGALAKYNGGPGNPQYGYADNVLAAAKKYGHIPVPSTAAAASAGTDASGGIVDKAKRSDALKALVTVALVAGGAGLVYIGANQGSGGALHSAVKGAVIAGAAA